MVYKNSFLTVCIWNYFLGKVADAEFHKQYYKYKY